MTRSSTMRFYNKEFFSYSALSLTIEYIGEDLFAITLLF